MNRGDGGYVALATEILRGIRRAYTKAYYRCLTETRKKELQEAKTDEKYWRGVLHSKYVWILTLGAIDGDDVVRTLRKRVENNFVEFGDVEEENEELQDRAGEGLAIGSGGQDKQSGRE